MKDLVEPDPTDQERMVAIRDAARAHLLDRDIAFNTRRAKRTLAQIAERIRIRKSIAYLEANVLTRIAIGAPPRRVQNELNKLFQNCIETGQSTRFEDFKETLRLAGERGANVEGISYPVSFEHLDEDLVWHQTTEVMQQIKEVLGDVWLNSGTLLGSVRDNGLIRHDNDVDLAVMLGAHTQETAAAAWVEAYRALHKAGMTLRAPSRNLRVFKVQGNAVKVDLFPAWIEHGNVWVYPHTAGELSQGALYPLGSCGKTGLAVPNDPVAFLELNYGAGWKVPDPSFSFPWNRANKNFETFRDVIHGDDVNWSGQ